MQINGSLTKRKNNLLSIFVALSNIRLILPDPILQVQKVSHHEGIALFF